MLDDTTLKIIIELGILVFFGLLYYLFQRSRILKNQDLDLIFDIVNYLKENQDSNPRLADCYQKIASLEIKRENIDLFNKSIFEAIDAFPPQLKVRWDNLYSQKAK